ncbi:MAG: methylenetetrahydrofolate--tRNA-(uracil(54)-C(5))-methyltransferase (FADH(2)-oxidizing) TrmFO [Bacillota bacterium]
MKRRSRLRRKTTLSKVVHIIGAGLAGSEAAWQVVRAGVPVVIHEMRPRTMSPAHHTGLFAELVCSNSLKAKSIDNAAGLLKEELRRLDSLVMRAADQHAVPAGQALAVDRDGFARSVTQTLKDHPLVTILEEEMTALPEPTGEPWIVATGPLTSPQLAAQLQALMGQDYLYFFDAAAPIVSSETLDMEKIYRASRYDKGDADYLNCPMNQDEYHAFWQELVNAEQHPLKEFEQDKRFFEGCMPVEEMARRGRETLAFGPLKPVGLPDPKTGRIPYAVVQLRQDNAAGDLYNLVGFQTNLRFGEQERVFRMIPGLEQAEFVRYGVMHRNLFINSPVLLEPSLSMRGRESLFFAGQMIGVEGYIESAATGLLAGRNAVRLLGGDRPLVPPIATMIGALVNYVTHTDAKHFQPMNAVFGIMPPFDEKVRDKKRKKQLYAERALAALEQWQAH